MIGAAPRTAASFGSESLNGWCGADQATTARLALVSGTRFTQPRVEGKGNVPAEVGFGSQAESRPQRLPEQLFLLCARRDPGFPGSFSQGSCSGLSRGWPGDGRGTRGLD